jgi:hypothetical protein
MGDLESAVRADLARWKLTDTSLAAAALDVVERLAAEDLRPAAAAMLHQRLDGYLADLRKIAPPAAAHDDVDEVNEQRKKRRRDAGTA